MANPPGRAGIRLLLVASQPGTSDVLVAGLDDAPGSSLPAVEVSRARAEAVTRRGLDEAEVGEAGEALGSLFEQPDSTLPRGLDHSGLFTAHVLTYVVPRRPDWPAACASAAAVSALRDADLIGGLGWTLQQHGPNLLLKDGPRDRAVAILLDGDEVFERPTSGFGVSPVEHALESARDLGLGWVLTLHRGHLRLYAADADHAVEKGGGAKFVDVGLDDLAGHQLGYLWLLFTPAALDHDGSVQQILEDSLDHATGLGSRLRDRMHRDVVPGLARTIASRYADRPEVGPRQAYHATLVVLFRLLLMAYAEDKRLPPYLDNAMYTHHSLRMTARRLAERGADPAFDAQATDLWDTVVSIWTAIRDGHGEWGVPPYGGSLFRSDSVAGSTIDRLRLTNAEFGPVLTALLVDVDDAQVRGPVDFRALSVRELGTLYEGLLESSLATAATDLVTDPQTKGFVPAHDLRPEIAAGEISFHGAAGSRKGTGSYFTPQFAVDRLLDGALEPALADHVTRITGLFDDGHLADAARAFFDFRVVDIAMGSGHFLVAAADRIALCLNDLLIDRPELRTELGELDALRSGALKGLQRAGGAVVGRAAEQIAQSALVQRQVAKRCLYGVDVDEIAVDLARLALWIRTSVPGLPMCDLSRTLVRGDSLTGIGTSDELIGVLEPGAASTQSLFRDEIVEGAEPGATARDRAALLAEATASEAAQAVLFRQESEDLLEPIRAQCDAAVAARLGVVDARAVALQGVDRLIAIGRSSRVTEAVAPLRPLHFPAAFPEVFSRGRHGFDVVLGNPPWDEVTVEEPKFWQRYEHGVMGLSPDPLKRRIRQLRAERPELLPLLAAEQEHAATIRAALLQGPYPGLGTGDVDCYKAFSWRYWQLLAQGGRMGVVFPRSLLNAAGSAPWRDAVLTTAEVTSVTSLTNTSGWVFPDVHGQYTVVLLVVRKTGTSADAVHISGPFHSRRQFDDGAAALAPLATSTLLGWGNGAAFPLLPTTRATEIFEAFRRHPRFDGDGGWRFRPVAEFHARNDRAVFDAGGETPGRWPVCTGASFSHWDPDFGEPYAWADPAVVIAALQRSRQRQARMRRSAFYGLPPQVVCDAATLPCRAARIAFRDVTNQTNTRTVVPALLPPDVVATNTAPYLFRFRGEEADEAYLLGVMSSVPFDWYARRYVELHVSFHILAAFPVPRPGPTDPLRTRVVEIAGRLAAVDHRYADWAAAVGVPVGSARDPRVKDDLVAELDALVSLLYGLSRADVLHVFETFHRGWDHATRLTAVLAHYDRWSVGAASVR